MVLSWGIFVLLGIGVFVVWFWQDSLGCRERANQTAAAACENLQLQFLDGTVAFARLSLARGKHGWLQFKRTYVFDYTAEGITRHKGFVVVQADSNVLSIPQCPERRVARNVAFSIDAIEMSHYSNTS